MEHTESDEPIFDISNKRRLGRSEAAVGCRICTMESKQ